MSDSEKPVVDSENSEKPLSEPMSDSEKGIEEVKKQMEEEKADDEPVEKSKAKRTTMSTEEKQRKKKEANKEYYIRTRQKMGVVEAPIEKVTPPKNPKTPKVVKVQEAYEPSSPRTRMTEAYRELRLQEQEKKSARYASWFQ